MYSSIILVLGLIFQVLTSQLYLRSRPPSSRLRELCRKSMPMNGISRSLFCHLLPAMNIQFEWNDKKIKDHAQSNSHLIPSPITHNDNHFNKMFVNDPESYYQMVPDYGIPHTFPLPSDNIFSEQFANEMQSNDFEDINQFDSSEQIEEHILNNFHTNRLIETPLIINKDMVLNTKFNESIEKKPSIESSVRFFEDFSPKRDRPIKSDALKLKLYDTIDNQWKPLGTKIEDLRERNKLKYRPSTPSPFHYKMSSSSTTTTSSPIIAIPSYIRRKYLLDLSRNEEKLTPQTVSNSLKILNKNTPKAEKSLNIETKAQTLKDWSMKINKSSSDWFQAFNKKTILQNKPQNDIIVKKLHTNYTKSSVIYSIEENTHKNDLNDKNKLNFNRLEIKTISKITKNSDISGKPDIDYPTYSPSVFSNFTCSGPGFYADTQFSCQVYHHCEQDYHQKFICPNGTLFNVRIQSCDHWFNVKCDHNSKKDLLIDDLTILKEKPKDRQMIEDIKVFVENISKLKQ